jgi:plastocyanin
LLLLDAGALEGQARGRIEGTATISTRLNQTRERVRIYDEPGVRPPAPRAEHAFARVVLYLDTAAALRARAPASARDTMVQRGATFTPHVLPILAGTTVDFPNQDPIYHNVFSLSRTREFDLGRYPSGESKSQRFDRPGVVPVFCRIHSDMSAYVIVLDNPYFVAPDSSGRFVIEDIPPGEYQFVIWHERIKPVSSTVRIAAGRTTQMAINIPILDPVR